jgi:hypothetical protein
LLWRNPAWLTGDALVDVPGHSVQARAFTLYAKPYFRAMAKDFLDEVIAPRSKEDPLSRPRCRGRTEPVNENETAVVRV